MKKTYCTYMYSSRVCMCSTTLKTHSTSSRILTFRPSPATIIIRGYLLCFFSDQNSLRALTTDDERVRTK